MSTKHKPKFKRVAQLKTADDFLAHLRQLGIELPFDRETDPSVFGAPYTLRTGKRIGNRFCILPMEGWDGTTDGRPSELTRRRWKNFAVSGAKLLWGCEAVAVRHEGRANPNQLLMNAVNLDDFKRLYESLLRDHHAVSGNTDDLYIGLQLTHSGRFCKPNSKSRMEPQILYHHPVLDKKFGLADDYPLMSDDDIDRLIDDFVAAAAMAREAGFHFVDFKHCHGYLGHEFLSAVDREGKYGGSFENRTRFLKSVIAGIRAGTPDLDIAIRLSVFDWVPFTQGPNGEGVPQWADGVYPYAFGGTPSGLGIDDREPNRLLDLVKSLGVELICITAGSPYYNPHIQRPALFPPSDGYQPPEDPMVGVSRQLEATAQIKKQHPDLAIVGSAYSYLQEWLPNVGNAVLKNGLADFIGLGRMVLSYPEMPHDILEGTSLKREKICRTFSDCTTAPRNGMISGCFPLDAFYKAMPEAEQLKTLKTNA